MLFYKAISKQNNKELAQFLLGLKFGVWGEAKDIKKKVDELNEK